ncbi:MAG: DUF3370 domain-containing protein [Cyanobacteria bacterium]|nr:DUF3370 domain-containing protein [Cyanobacteriota bacterium]MDW8200167.1 DUF3370 domain-containing protein [Cyanobacteriota bacterium SKYGB_h_bin112]
MILSLTVLPFAQVPPTPPSPTPQEIVVPQEVRALPGNLDKVLVFNSNSPEVVQKEGILLSTFPPDGKRAPAAHLNVPLSGRFDVFAHHVAKPITPEDLRTLYLGIILHNPSQEPVTVNILQGASYLSQPDAPFIDLPPVVDASAIPVYAGPGSRVAGEVLRGLRQAEFPPQVVIPPGESRMLLNLPIPVRPFTPPLNGRSTLLRLRSTGTVYAASLAMFAKSTENGDERAPTLEEWQQLLIEGELSGPRDRAPTPPDQTTGSIIYGRVAGVAQGSKWETVITDNAATPYLSVPTAGRAISYGISTLVAGRLGTGQIQTAPLLVRYADTAYAAHGNYGIEYNLTLPLYNGTGQTQLITVAVQTAIKQDVIREGLRFFDPLPRNVFFRGLVRIRYTDDQRLPRTRYVHLVQRRGQRGEPLAVLTMPPGDRRLVNVSLVYPADATPPQVLTIAADLPTPDMPTP